MEIDPGDATLTQKPISSLAHNDLHKGASGEICFQDKWSDANSETSQYGFVKHQHSLNA